MNAQDVAIARTVRREFGKRALDSTRLDVQVVQGRVTLGGIVTTLRDQRDINLKDEMAMTMKLLTRDRAIREVQESVRLIQTEKEVEEVNTRGRIRPGRK